MNLIFFGDEEVFSYLDREISFTPKLITTDEEECRDWLEQNGIDKKVYLFIDYDLGKKKVDKYLQALRNEFPELVAVLVYEKLKIKELKKHQAGQYAADGYLKKPLSKSNIEAVLEDFELGDFITKENLLEEGVPIPPIPALGNSSDEDILADEQELVDQYEEQKGEFFGDEVNHGIQVVFDRVMGTNAATEVSTNEVDLDLGSGLSLNPGDYEIDENELEEFDDDSQIDLSPGGDAPEIGNLDIEEEEEISQESNLSFDFNASKTDVEFDDAGSDISLGEEGVPLESSPESISDMEASDSTLVISTDELLSLKADGIEENDESLGNDLQETEDGLSLEEEDMGQDGDDLFDDDFEAVDKTIVEKYDVAEESSNEKEAAADSVDLDFDDNSLENEIDGALDDDFVDDFSTNDNSLSLTENEHILPKDEDLEFPSMSEVAVESLGDSSTNSEINTSDFQVEDFDESSVDQTLSQIVKTDQFDTADLSDGGENNANDEGLDDISDFELEKDDDQLMDINKMDLSADDSETVVVDEIDFGGDDGISEMAKPGEGGESLQFDSSTEETNEQIQIEEVELEVAGDDHEIEQNDIDQGLVFENVNNEPANEIVHERPLGVSELISDDDKKLISGHHENELIRLQTIIRQLREEREELLETIQSVEADKKILERENLGLRAEVDEQKIELGIIRKRHREELEELKYRNRISEEKKLLAQEKSKKTDRELSRLQQRIHIDLNKVRQREKELESKLELAKIDSDSQVKARDQKIIELKRKIDQLEFNMENVAMKEQQSRTEKTRIEERLNRIMKTLRGSIELLEDDIQYDTNNED